VQLNPPYRYQPALQLNEFGISEPPSYSTQDIAKVLKMNESAVQWRFRQGWYREVRKDKAGRRIFSLDDIRAIVRRE
jgi:hypothetical protein